MSESEPLPPFSGDKPVCAKCGNETAFTEYRAHGRCMHDQSGLVIGVEPNERLHRQCTRCDYAWDEATVTGPVEAPSLLEATCTTFSEHGWGRCVEPSDHAPGKHMYRNPKR